MGVSQANQHILQTRWPSSHPEELRASLVTDPFSDQATREVCHSWERLFPIWKDKCEAWKIKCISQEKKKLKHYICCPDILVKYAPSTFRAIGVVCRVDHHWSQCPYKMGANAVRTLRRWRTVPENHHSGAKALDHPNSSKPILFTLLQSEVTTSRD